MALDDVVKTTITGPRIEEAMYRTLRWIDRCIAGKPNTPQWHHALLYDRLKATTKRSVNLYFFNLNLNVAVSVVLELASLVNLGDLTLGSLRHAVLFN